MPRQEYHFNAEGKLVKGLPPRKTVEIDPAIESAKRALEMCSPTKGELKFSSNREFAKYCVKRSMEERNITNRDLNKSAKSLHYFPKSAAEYIAMRNFEGRFVK